MRAALLAFAVGVWLLQSQPRLPAWPGPALVACLLAAVLALACAHRRRQRSARSRPAQWALLALVAVTSIGAGFFWAAWRADARLAEALPASWEGEDITIVGVVDDLPLRTDRGWRFAFAVERVETPEASVPSRLSLAWYATRVRGASPVEPPVLAAAERWRLTVRLRRPHGTVNPHGFDVEAWLLDSGLRATGQVTRDGDHARLSAFAGRPIDHVQRWRDHLRTRITEALAGQTYAGVIVALAIGEQRAIPAEQWQLFNRTGIGHLLAISGMHVTLFATLVGGAVLAAWRRIPVLAARLPAQRAAALIGAAASGGYVLLAGSGVPAQRTFYMLVAAALALWFGTPGRATSVLLFALTIVLLIDPWAVRAAGFWLSFGAVAVILGAASGRLGPLGTWAAAVRTQAAVTVGLAPLTLVLFQQVSVISPVANALAIPVVTFLVVPPALLGIALPFAWPFQLAHGIFTLLAAVVRPLGESSSAVWAQHAPGALAMTLATVGTALAVAPRGIPGKTAMLGWFAPVFLWLPSSPLPGAFRLAVLDVGQGLATVVQTHAHALVYDTGPRFNDQADSGGRIVLPFLRGEGIRRLDALVVSHNDNDHSGGARSLLDAVPVERVLTSAAEDSELRRRRAGEGRPAERCQAGSRWEWDGVRFEMLHPAAELYDGRWKGNDLSCVLRIANANASVLLAGDIEERAERELLDRSPGLGPVDIVIAPHHGSRTSSSRRLVEATAPAEVVFAVGYRNRFGHPRAEVVERWLASGARQLRSDRDGALLFDVGDAVRIVAWRREELRYWRDAATVGAPPLE